MKKVSIVVPCYNVAVYLDRCVESLIKQSIGIENLEIILVDDASTDDGRTWEKIAEIERNFPDTVIAISLEENLRQGGARNVGISYASGEYLMFCDADDWLALEAAECLYQRAKEYDADVVEYRMEKVYADTDISELSTEEGEGSRLLILDEEEIKKVFYLTSTEECSLGCMRKFYRMRMIKENNIRFAEHLICEEPSFTLPVRLYEQRHYQLDKLLYFYYMSAGSTSRGSWDERKLDNMQVWLILMEDLEERGFLQKYYAELEYLFYSWGYWLSVRMLLVRGYTITIEEIEFLVQKLLALFPDIRENKYLKTTKDGLGILLKSVLDMELTQESVRVMNEVLRKCVSDRNKISDSSKMRENDMEAQEIRDQFNELLRKGQYQTIKELFDVNSRVVEQENDLAIARVMLSVCDQEKEEGQRILFEKVRSLEDIVNRYTKLMFYLRRFEFDVMDNNMDEFNRFLKRNQVSSQELFVVMYCGSINREKTLQIIADKMINGEIAL